jgi:hypothetical protein
LGQQVQIIGARQGRRTWVCGGRKHRDGSRGLCCHGARRSKWKCTPSRSAIFISRAVHFAALHVTQLGERRSQKPYRSFGYILHVHVCTR